MRETPVLLCCVEVPPPRIISLLGGWECHRRARMSRMLRAGSRASMRMASQRKLGVQVWCRCLWEYAAEYEDDLRIEPGDII